MLTLLKELVKLKIAPVVSGDDKNDWGVNAGQIEEGTYGGTQLALTEMYDRVERA